jgi:hypothetical protein
VDGDIADAGTAERVVEQALVNNAGILIGKAFADYTTGTSVQSE